jgi:hypothetical protein
MIPIYFDDPALSSNDVDRVSQMFISDKAGKTSSERDLGFITRKHGSIQCLSELPCTVLLLDLNVDPKLSVTFPKKKPKHPKTDQCLRIYASGISGTTFPFLRDHFNLAELTAAWAGLATGRSAIADHFQTSRCTHQIREYCYVTPLAVGGTRRIIIHPQLEP